jgi:hypothetical protein
MYTVLAGLQEESKATTIDKLIIDFIFFYLSAFFVETKLQQDQSTDLAKMHVVVAKKCLLVD